MTIQVAIALGVIIASDLIFFAFYYLLKWQFLLARTVAFALIAASFLVVPQKHYVTVLEFCIVYMMYITARAVVEKLDKRAKSVSK